MTKVIIGELRKSCLLMKTEVARKGYCVTLPSKRCITCIITRLYKRNTTVLRSSQSVTKNQSLYT